MPVTAKTQSRSVAACPLCQATRCQIISKISYFNNDKPTKPGIYHCGQYSNNHALLSRHPALLFKTALPQTACSKKVPSKTALLQKSSSQIVLSRTATSQHSRSQASLSSTARSHIMPSRVSPSTLVPRILPRSQTGFTLVEIVVVVVIISIFAGMISLSVGSSESRKNRAFYEHLTDSLSYVRLLSAERMQPMGLSLQADKQGQVTPVIVTLSNPYIAYQTVNNQSNSDSSSKNAMELSANLSGMSGSDAQQSPTPSWELETDITLPELPDGVSLSIQSLEASSLSSANGVVETRELQPWFTTQTVPQVLWFGTGQATPVTIEVRHQSRLVGEVITIMPDGSTVIAQGL